MSNRRTRRDVLRSSAAVATTAAVAGVAAAEAGSEGVGDASEVSASSVSLQEEFDTLQADWRVDSDLTYPSGEEYWDVSVVAPSSMDSRTARFVADGRASTGMAWIYAPVEIDPGVEYEGSLTVRAWSSDEFDDPPTVLRAYLGPDLPTTTDGFPGPRESWFYEGRETGLYASLWQEAGWNEYTCRWATPEFETDQLYLAIGVEAEAAARFVHHLDAVDLELTPASGTESTVSVADASVTTTDETPVGDREVTFDEDTNTVEVLGPIELPSGCHEPVVSETSYDPSSDELAVMLGAEKPGDEYCTQAVEEATYRLSLDCEGGMPGSVSVVTPDGRSVSAADAPTLVDVELVDADGSETPQVTYDDTAETVTVEETVEFSNGCRRPVISAASFDDEADVLTIDVSVREEGDVCTQEVSEESFAVRATFDGGLPGAVDYDGPDV